MVYSLQKRLAADIMDVGLKRVWFDETRLEEITKTITKADIKRLIADGAIREKPEKSISKFRIRKAKEQKKKGRQKGHGSRKGKKTARSGKKELWVAKIRVQRTFLKELKEKKILNQENYRNLMRKAKGGFFRSKRHIKLFMEDRELTK
tara:strand:+ start:455 stop:901 length:447 start_codon:yes stop_codon:yes gene_type:complete